MGELVIAKELKDGSKLQARFHPEKGMNLLSLKWNDVELIDQSTSEQFQQRYAGLGAMIGPHFHRRYEKMLPKLSATDKFPHIAQSAQHGSSDPFSHGIGRYAPWTVEKQSESALRAVLTGKDSWNDVTLAQLQGQDFKMTYDVEIDQSGLNIDLSVVSDTDSLVGIHYYYRLPKGAATVQADVSRHYLDQGESKVIPSDWSYNDRGELMFDLSKEADYTFHPHLNPIGGVVKLGTSEYTLRTRFSTTSQELSWQLYHPKGASFVCIEPMSAANPRKPQLSVSRLGIHLEVSAPES